MRLKSLKIRPLISFILHSAAGRVFLISLAGWLLSFTYCKYRYWREPHSAFFKEDHVYNREYSAFREKEADIYVDQASAPGAILEKASEDAELCAVFLTIHRDGHNYINPAVGSMLEGLAQKERAKLFASVFFVNTDPTIHPSWNETWMTKAVDSSFSYDVDSKTMAHLEELEKSRDFQAKGVFDYVYALESCYATNAKYFAIFEGDIILADGWLAKTLKALHDIENTVVEGGKWWNWVYLRLFYTETYLQWEPQEDYWYGHMSLTFFMIISASYTILIGIRLFVPGTRKILDNLTIAVICLVIVPAFTALCFMIGKFNLFPPDEVFALNRHGCCSQALVFPREQVKELTTHLTERGRGQTDMMIEDYSNDRRKQRLALFHNMAQHVGSVSSRDNDAVSTKSVWAFWFEAYDPQVLRKEHERLLDLI